MSHQIAIACDGCGYLTFDYGTKIEYSPDMIEKYRYYFCTMCWETGVALNKPLLNEEHFWKEFNE